MNSTRTCALHTVKHREDCHGTQCGAIISETRRLHPLERAARVHAGLVIIQSFRGGNGRASRLVMNLEFMRAGFPTAFIPVEDRAVYYENVDKAGKDADCAPFVQRLAKLIERSFEPNWYLFGIA